MGETTIKPSFFSEIDHRKRLQPQAHHHKAFGAKNKARQNQQRVAAEHSLLCSSDMS